jgi:transposase-like protein
VTVLRVIANHDHDKGDRSQIDVRHDIVCGGATRSFSFADRRALIDRVVRGGERVSAVARDLGVSRATAHKWLRRYRERGEAGLVEESRRPHRSPSATPSEIASAVLSLRTEHPEWGPARLRPALMVSLGAVTPSERTIARILRRAASRAA